MNSLTSCCNSFGTLQSFRQLWTVLLLVLISGCEIINPAEPVPGYIKIEKFTVTPTPSLGTDSNKITDVFDYLDTKFQGSYPLPAQFPVIGTGSHEMLFYAGVIINGISNTRVDYPLYASYAETVTIEPGKVVTIHPVVKYADNVVASWLENFDNVGLSIVKSSGAAVEIVKLQQGDVNNFEGKSGAVYLNTSQSYFSLNTDTSYVLPKANAAVFLELNYKCNSSFTVGLIAITGSTPYNIPVLTLKAKPVWNKIYIELASVVKSYPDAYYFKIYFEAYKDAGVATGQYYFDNFKLLHN